MPCSWHTAWVRTRCSKAAVGAWFRFKEVDRTRAKRQKRAIDKNHRNSGNPQKFYWASQTQGKKFPSHYKETILKAVHYYTCIIAQSHLRDGLTRIKGGCVRITTRACRRASCFATAHAQTWATFSAQNCPLQTVTSVIYHSESQQNNPAHCCRSAAGHLIPFSSSLKNHQSSCSFCVFHLLLLSPPLPPLLESGYIWFLQAAWNTPWQSDLQNSVWSCKPSSHMLFFFCVAAFQTPEVPTTTLLLVTLKKSTLYSFCPSVSTTLTCPN